MGENNRIFLGVPASVYVYCAKWLKEKGRMDFVIFVPPRENMQSRVCRRKILRRETLRRLSMGPDILRCVGVVEFFARLIDVEVGGAVVFLCPLTG